MKIISSVIFFFLLANLVLLAKPQVVIDSSVCDSHSEYSYAACVPELEENTQIPAIFFFEPAARAKLPLRLYKSLAEKYQVALICSYNSRNGPYERNKKIADAVINDALSKYAIDENALILSGFSGGSRFSYNYALKRSSVKGIIGCGAGLPFPIDKSYVDSFHYSAIIGLEDCNFREMISLKDQYRNWNKTIQFITFNGAHEWPVVQAFERALVRMLYELNPIENNYFCKTLLELENQAYKIELDSNELISAFWTQENILLNPKLKKFDSAVTNKRSNITELKEYKEQERKFLKSLIREDTIQHRLINSLRGIHNSIYLIEENHKPISWWKNEAKRLKKLSNNKSIFLSRVGKRSIGFIQMNCYETHLQYMAEKAYKQALELSKILLLTESNKYYFLLQAQSYAALGNISKAKEAIEKAKNQGFSNLNWAKENQYLKILFD